MNAVSKIEGSFVETEVDEELVLMRVSDGDFFSLEGTARTIWGAIDGTSDRTGIVRRVADEFGAAPSEISADIHAFLDDLVAAGLIAG